uniref:Protein kinase domain-containing protein n=1 Tax=Alexandrium monilatum TaxID=311494 RepID=A0A7S4SS02_9DINO
MTEPIGKRWYNAPEVLCSWVSYDTAIDVWSIGCVFAQMLVRRQPFRGHSTRHQLQLIVDLLGTPSREELDAIQSKACRQLIDSLPYSEGKCKETFADASEESFDLLRMMLQFSPHSRVMVPQALELSYIGRLSCPDDEPTRGALGASDLELERREESVQTLGEDFFQEALHYCPDAGSGTCRSSTGSASRGTA